MVIWRHQIRLGDIWNNDDLTLEQKRDRIVERVECETWYQEAVANPTARPDGLDYSDYEIESIIYDLKHSEGEDGFNSIWHEFYDYCDEHRIWVDIHTLQYDDQIRAELTKDLKELKR